MLTLIRKDTGRLGVMRHYRHPRHGKVEVVTFPNEQGADIVFVGHERGWNMVLCQNGGQRERWYRSRVAAADKAERQASRERKRAAAEPARRQA